MQYYCRRTRNEECRRFKANERVTYRGEIKHLAPIVNFGKMKLVRKMEWTATLVHMSVDEVFFYRTCSMDAILKVFRCPSRYRVWCTSRRHTCQGQILNRLFPIILHVVAQPHRKKDPLPIEVQLGSNALKLTREGWKLGECLGYALQAYFTLVRRLGILVSGENLTSAHDFQTDHPVCMFEIICDQMMSSVSCDLVIADEMLAVTSSTCCSTLITIIVFFVQIRKSSRRPTGNVSGWNKRYWISEETWTPAARRLSNLRSRREWVTSRTSC